MNFTRKAEKSGSSAEVIAAEFTRTDKQEIIGWLAVSLELDQFADSDHPLKGSIEISTLLIEIEDVHALIERFTSEGLEMSFTPSEFIALTALAEMWKGNHKVTELDDYARANEVLYERRPELRDYVLSDTYKEEIKVFDRVVTLFKDAYLAVYPESRTVIDDIDFGANRHG
ncbi:hypothetical protein [Epibacterium ulvae]|uniref:hypothetical protein n=1 Tax=Epibacterium ulvae TaxID=1156985 RepID=UPI0024919025|nr:hypothetical protein [Epibacterium ulvae]